MTTKQQAPTGVKLSELYAVTKTISIEYGGCELQVTYKSGFWTCKTEAWYFDKQESYGIKDAKLIVENVTAWNVTNEDGTQVPITSDVVEGLDQWLTNLIVSTMIRGVNPNPTNSQG